MATSNTATPTSQYSKPIGPLPAQSRIGKVNSEGVSSDLPSTYIPSHGGGSSPFKSNPLQPIGTSTNPLIQQAEAPQIEVPINPIGNNAQGFSSTPIQYPTSLGTPQLNDVAKSLNLTAQDIATIYKIQINPKAPVNEFALR